MLRSLVAIAGTVCLAAAVAVEPTRKMIASPVVTRSPDDPMDGENDRINSFNQVKWEEGYTGQTSDHAGITSRLQQAMLWWRSRLPPGASRCIV
jgi:hypothetical protein